MKYLMLCVTTLIFSLTFTSCSDDDDESNVSPEGKRLVNKIKYHWSDDEEETRGEFLFSYDKSGKISAIEIKDYYNYIFDKTQAYAEIWQYTYSVSGDKLTVKCVYKDEECPEYNGTYGGTFILNDKGFVVSGEEVDSDEDEFTYTCYYNNEDYLTKMECTRNGGRDEITNYVWDDDDIVRGIYGGRYTYYTEENKANIEFAGLIGGDWMLGYDRSYLGSVGYLGKMNKHLCKTDSNGNQYTYSFDGDGNVTKITVDSDGGNREYYEIEYK